METSGTAKNLILQIKPESIEDLSAISALNRPGPLQAGLDKQYIVNKINNTPPSELPKQVAEILKASYWTLIYQEQILSLFTDLAGFTAKEADDVRRAMGKKKLEVLEVYKEKFIEGAQSIGNLLKDYAESLWSDILVFADYCLAGNNNVLLEDDSSTPIKEIVEKQLASKVMSFDAKLFEQTITQWHSKGVHDVYRYTLEDGSFVDCTSNHKFLTEGNNMVEIQDIHDLKINLKIIK